MGYLKGYFSHVLFIRVFQSISSGISWSISWGISWSTSRRISRDISWSTSSGISRDISWGISRDISWVFYRIFHVVFNRVFHRVFHGVFRSVASAHPFPFGARSYISDLTASAHDFNEQGQEKIAAKWCWLMSLICATATRFCFGVAGAQITRWRQDKQRSNPRLTARLKATCFQRGHTCVSTAVLGCAGLGV